MVTRRVPEARVQPVTPQPNTVFEIAKVILSAKTLMTQLNRRTNMNTLAIDRSFTPSVVRACDALETALAMQTLNGFRPMREEHKGNLKLADLGMKSYKAAMAQFDALLERGHGLMSKSDMRVSVNQLLGARRTSRYLRACEVKVRREEKIAAEVLATERAFEKVVQATVERVAYA